MKFTGLLGQVISTPILIKENPLDIAFTAQIRGDVVVAHLVGSEFIGIKRILRKGDYVKMNGISQNGELIVGHITLDNSAALGRNINCYA